MVKYVNKTGNHLKYARHRKKSRVSQYLIACQRFTGNFPPFCPQSALSSSSPASVDRIRERRKTTQELQREECEDYSPCERYAMRHGYVAAYKRFFGQRRGE